MSQCDLKLESGVDYGKQCRSLCVKGGSEFIWLLVKLRGLSGDERHCEMVKQIGHD